MTTKNVREFLQGFSAEELKNRKILRGETNQLKGTSVEALLDLMKEQGVTRLESPDHDWYLDEERRFSNRWSGDIKEGNIDDLERFGSVFNLTNNSINPYFKGYAGTGAADIEGAEGTEEAEELRFELERDMQKAIRRNIEQLEPGLKIIDGGQERKVEAGRIDITAAERGGKRVVIELKTGTADPSSVTQTLAYMASVHSEDKKPVSGILVASDFHSKVLQAAQAVPNLQLKQYSFSFTFKDR